MTFFSNSEVRRRIEQAKAKEDASLVQAHDACPLCGHLWRQHDPEDGKCDAYSYDQHGPCLCGVGEVWWRERNAALSRAALEDWATKREEWAPADACEVCGCWELRIYATAAAEYLDFLDENFGAVEAKERAKGLWDALASTKSEAEAGSQATKREGP